MAFDFIVETPQHRKVNRNNNKVIQKRATQAGARTRLGNKHGMPSYPIADAKTTNLPSRKASSRPIARNVLLANADLTMSHNSPFLARFGRRGQMLYLPDPNAFLRTGCFRLPDPSLSVLQRQLLVTLDPQPLAREPNRLCKIMNLTRREFLSHLPSHYGHLPFLDEAMECLMARLHDTVPLLRPTNHAPLNQPSPTALYGKALTSLRSAIDGDLTRNLTYIWFAILLLTLFELLSFGDEPGWLWHFAGAARMLYKLGPENVNSEFHMSLLSSQSRIMVMETIFTGKPCYLADSRWQEAMRRTILNCEDFGDRSRTSIELWALGTRIPNLFQSVSDHVHGLKTSDSISPRDVLHRLLNDTGRWRKKWLEAVETTCRNVLRDASIRHQSLMILLSFYMLTVITNRLRVAIDPVSALKMENETLMACASVFRLRKDFMACQFDVRNNGSIQAKVADGTQQTAASWKKEIGNARRSTPIRAEVFDEWCSLIGRTSEGQPPYPLLTPGPEP